MINGLSEFEVAIYPARKVTDPTHLLISNYTACWHSIIFYRIPKWSTDYTKHITDIPLALDLPDLHYYPPEY